MTTLFQNVRTYNLTRNNDDLDNNNNTGDDNFWIRIRKSLNGLAKIDLISRALFEFNNGNITFNGLCGFDIFDINSDSWKRINNIPGYEEGAPGLLSLPNDNIIILNFESLDKRNFYLKGDDIEMPELKYLIVRLITSEEIEKEIIDNENDNNYKQYYNYQFAGEIIGPMEFIDFNTNYCLKKTTIYKTDPNVRIDNPIVNNTLRNDTLDLYHPLNWCGLKNTDINSYTTLDLKIKVAPIYPANKNGIFDVIEHTTSTIFDSYVLPEGSTYYSKKNYELSDIFWCSLNSPRHLKLILASSENAQEIVDNVIPNKEYIGVNYEGSFRYIKNFLFTDILQLEDIGLGTLISRISQGNTGGGYRKNPGSLELMRETYLPYYTKNGKNEDTNEDFDLNQNTEYYGYSYDSSPTIWKMRTNFDDNGEPIRPANYYEIRYKPLLPIKDYINNVNGENKILKVTFEFGESLESKVTFERYKGTEVMDNNSSRIFDPPGNSHGDAIRNQESIEFQWNGNNNNLRRMIIIDVASGFSINSATITTDCNLYQSIEQNQSLYDIKSYVYSLKLTEPINNLSYKYYNTAIKNFIETNTSDMVKNNRRFNVELVPNNSSQDFSIFAYDDSIIGVIYKTNPLDERNNINLDTPFNLVLGLEKIDIENYNTQSVAFENATNLESSLNNVNILREQIIYLFNNDFSNSSGVNISNPIISLNIKNDSINNIALTKGLINDNDEKEKFAINTIPQLREALTFDLRFFSFLIKQNFLTDYWKFKKNLNQLALTSPVNQKMSEYDYQQRVAASIHLIDISLSGQIFLINTAKNKNNISYIKTVKSEEFDEIQIRNNPTLDLINIDNIYPTISKDNPIYLNLQNNTSGNQSIFLGQNYTSYPSNFIASDLKSGTTEINQPIYLNSNVFDIIKIFSNLNENPDKTVSTGKIPTQYNGKYYYDITVGKSSNEKIINYNIFPGKIFVNLVELPDIKTEDTTISLSNDNRKIIITWPRYYYNTSQGETTWTIVRKDMASLKELVRVYTIDSNEINYENENIVYIDTEIRRFDKYKYTISGVFNFNSFVTINNVPKNYRLSLNIEPFTLNDVFVCYGYTRRFPFGRFNTTTTNLKLFVPKLLRTDINPTTKNLFRNQLLLKNPTPSGVTEEYHLENNITNWPGGRGACKNASGGSETFGRTLTQTNENIYSNTSNKLSKKQIYNLLSKSRFRPDR